MSKPVAMSAEEIAQALTTLPGWECADLGSGENCLKREYRFKDFPKAIAFMVACVPEIQAMNHHPVWENRYHDITVWLNTWDVSHKVTSLDVTLARLLDRIAEEHGVKID
jgi:4a-hydroxytetrahydrobiopterin dehydratase